MDKSKRTASGDMPSGWIELTCTDCEGRKVEQAFNIAARPPLRVCPTKIGKEDGCIVMFAGGVEYFVYLSVVEVLRRISRSGVEEGWEDAKVEA